MIIEITERERLILSLGLSVMMQEGFDRLGDLTHAELESIGGKLGHENADDLMWSRDKLIKLLRPLAVG